jgi:hypothetical protein
LIRTVSDENLPVERRKELLLKKIPRDLAKWKRDIHKGSIRKLRKLRGLMKELGVDESPWKEKIDELRDVFKVLEVMES